MNTLGYWVAKYEGLRLTCYDDATGAEIRSGQLVVGNPTIGYGCNLAAGITKDEAVTLMNNRIAVAWADLVHFFPDWAAFGEARQTALADMRFNMGAKKFREFEKMIAAINQGDWATAAEEAKSSAWFHQVGIRGIDDVNLLHDGDF